MKGAAELQTMAAFLFLHLALLFLLAGPAAPQTPGPAQLDLLDRSADFGARLYRAVAGRTDDNVLLAPLAVFAGMLAVLGGTSGPTQNQLLQGLTLTGLDPQTLPDQFQALRDAVLQPALRLQQGAALFLDRSFQTSPSFQDLVQTKYGGQMQSVSFSSPAEAQDVINRWVQDLTRHQDQNLLSSLDRRTQLLLVSAAAYQMRFSPLFNTSLTQVERFYVDRYHVAMVPMMFRADKYFLAYDRGVKAGVLKLPMADGAAMLAVLPDEDVDLTTVEEEMTSEKIRAWIRQLKKTKLEVQLPVFQLKRSYALKDVLQALYVTQVFQDGDDFSSMGGASGASLSQVYHASVVTMDESGDDGGSGGGATAFSSPPPRLTFNRPFIFIIYQQASGSLLLMGRVTNPTEN